MTTMTIEDVKEIIEAADEDFSEGELSEMFEAVYERAPDQKDWNDGVFSLICAGV